MYQLWMADEHINVREPTVNYFLFFFFKQKTAYDIPIRNAVWDALQTFRAEIQRRINEQFTQEIRFSRLSTADGHPICFSEQCGAAQFQHRHGRDYGDPPCDIDHDGLPECGRPQS